MSNQNYEEKDFENNTDFFNKGQIISGASWNFLELFFREGFQFITRLILARLLVPEHFGLIGMAVVFTGFVNVMSEFGLGEALIQRKKEKLGPMHFYTGFWVVLVFGIVSFVLMSTVISFFAAWFYDETQLTRIIPVLSVPMLIKPLSFIPRVKLMRELKFKPIAIIESFSVIIGGISSIIIALLGGGVWSIALKGVISVTIKTPLFWRAVKWRPKWAFSKDSFSEIFSFGVFVLVKRIVIYFVKNFDYLIIGRLLGSYFLGVYTLAFMLTDVFRSKFMNVLNKVMFPVYGRAQHSPKIVGNYYLKITRYNTLFIYLVMGVLFCLAKPIIEIFFGNQWVEAIVPVQALSLAVIVNSTAGTSSEVLKGIGKPKADLYIYLGKSFFVTIPMIIAGIQLAGINGASYAILFSRMVNIIITWIVMKNFIGLQPKKIFFAVMPAGIGLGALIIFSSILNYFFGLPETILSLIGYAFFLACCYFGFISFFVKDDFKEVYTTLKIRLKQRKKIRELNKINSKKQDQ